MEALISIIVPVYGVERYLDECVESIINQTYKNLEIILIDDGSPDNCPKICDDWAKKDSRIKVIHQNNAGVSVARNIGLDNAQGDYIGFVDGDDYIDADLYETVMSVFDNYNVDIVSFDFEYVTEKSKSINSFEKIHKDTIYNRIEALSELLLGNITNHFCNKIYKKYIFDNIKCPVGYVMEDMSTVYKLFLKSEKVYCINKRLYYYRQRKNSIVNAVSTKLISDTFFAHFTRYNNLKVIYPNIAELGFINVALSARALYDRSLWENVDSDVLKEAKKFLGENKDKVLSVGASRLFKIYYKHQKIYNSYRVVRHRIGNTVKFISSLLRK